jgi:hypothetical protein
LISGIVLVLRQAFLQGLAFLYMEEFMSSFLDSTGLSRLVSKITDYFAKKDGSYPNMNVGTVNGYTVGKSVPSDAKFTDTDTKVTSAANHYTPSRDTSADKSASASGASAAWSIDVVKGVTLQTDGKGHVTGVSVTSGKIPANPNTDTKVTSAANHYAPSRDTSADKSASASGATAAWSIDVVKGVTLQTDGKGHVTGVSVTSGKIPAKPSYTASDVGAAPSSHTHKYAASATAGGSATMAEKLNYDTVNSGDFYVPVFDHTNNRLKVIAGSQGLIINKSSDTSWPYIWCKVTHASDADEVNNYSKLNTVGYVRSILYRKSANFDIPLTGLREGDLVIVFCTKSSGSITVTYNGSKAVVGATTVAAGRFRIYCYVNSSTGLIASES